MTFCGDCGLQLAPNTRICPRCGAVNEPIVSADDLYPAEGPTAASSSVRPPSPKLEPSIQLDGPTVASSPIPVPRPAQPSPSPAAVPPTRAEQQKLVLRPEGSGPHFGRSGQGQGAQNPGTQPPASTLPIAYANFGPSAQPATTSPGTRTPDAPGVPQSNAGYQTALDPYATVLYQEPESPRPRKKKGRVVVLLSVLVILLLVLGAGAVFILQAQGLFNIGGSPTPTPTLTPVQQGQAVIQQYYDDINKKDYQGAYNLWGLTKNSQTFDEFKAGYAQTQHDDLVLGTSTTLSDGTIQIPVTIHATESTSSGVTQQSTYQGSYIVGLQNGSWKILNGSIQKVS